MAPTDVLPAGEPLGFPACQQCPYARAGPAWICVECAGKTLDAIAPRSCPICSQRLEDGASCRNSLCNDANRRIERIDAIAYLSEPLHSPIHRYKYQAKTGWSLIFGRLLVGWLEAHGSDQPPDLIIANPTYIVPGQSSPGHIETIIRSAAIADFEGRWAFDLESPAAVIKIQPTGQTAGQTAAAKRATASALRSVLEIPDSARTLERDILIFDDVCTTGSQLNAVAECLLDEGSAARVRALVLARAPWKPLR
jgi:predicted amidophosphoribosyltransferase